MVDRIVEAVMPQRELPHYEVSDAELGPGASFGNGHVWVNTGTDGRIHTFFSTDVGEEIAGPLIIRYCSGEARVAERAGVGSERADVPLAPAGTGAFTIHPVYQRHSFDLPGDIEVQETVFVPRGEDGSACDKGVAYSIVDLSNGSDEPRLLTVFAFARLGGSRRSPVVHALYSMQHGALFAHEEDNEDWVRTLAATRQPSGFEVTDDFGGTYDMDAVAPLEGRTEDIGDVMGCLELRVELAPGARDRFAFLLAFTAEGQHAAEAELHGLRQVDSILRMTLEHYEEQLAVCRVMTPDPVINQGALWSKVNMLRVLAHYPQGEAFTNEPGVSSNVVVRDAIWFIYGCDHFLPDVSRTLLDACARFQYPDGKLPEYFDARSGRVADYEMNVNDATPLFVLGVNHYVRSTGDLDYLEGIYDSVRRASEYILSQRDERGLVYCDAEGVEVRGICSWRNVIPDYRINGAVTEINAECAAALRAMGHMAENIGRAEDYDRFYGAARELTEAVNEHLLDADRQLYLLNIDTNGRRRTDVTADELFPVLFRVAPEEVAFRIIRRLNSPDFWTPAGLRTVSRLDPLYDPTRYVGLLGGVWPGLTWWYSFAAARYHPEFMVQGLHASFEHYNRHPRVYNTVPGQFSEWFDGESLINRGMRLSPWEPPRFLWAAVEGVCGLMVQPDAPHINPLMPPDWKWSALVNVCYHGGRLTTFAARRGGKLHVYANRDFISDGPREVLSDDLTALARAGHPGLHVVALADGERVVVGIGSCRREAITTPVSLRGVLEERRQYRLRQYSSERDEWGAAQQGRGTDFATLGVRVEAEGYHVLEFTRE